jgi:ribosome-associated protein
MTPADALAPVPGLVIPLRELLFSFSRSGGPGGQNVNKVSTRVTLSFDVGASPSLSADQKRLLRARLGTRMSGEGVLRVVCQATRSQAANREQAIERFAALVAAALKQKKPRRRTRVTAGARERRLEEKKRHGRIKRQRRGDAD